jgi:predicted amidohydrolase
MAIKVAGVQMDIEIANVNANLEKTIGRLRETVSNGAQLTVFPECTFPGYCFGSLEEAREHAETLDGPTLTQLTNVCKELQTKTVVGFFELDGERIFNALALVGPDGVMGSYRKAHLPHLGVDRFTTPGDRGFAVTDAGEVKIGMNICYDSSFPEASRALALAGAELITLPTNWPPTSGRTADLIPNARALENHVYFMSVNRVGHERGFEFIGKSKICDPSGADLAFANHANEEILYAEIDPGWARNKHLCNIPGEHEVHRFDDRRPDLYGPLNGGDPEI